MRKEYGNGVADRLAPFEGDVRNRTQMEIDPEGIIRALSNLPVAEKYQDPGFMTAERFLAGYCAVGSNDSH